MSSNKSQMKPQSATSMIDIKTSQSFHHDSNIIEVKNNNNIIEESAAEFAGKHYIVDFWGTHFLQDIDVIEKALTDASSIAGAVLLHIHLHQFSDGGGITGVALLAESHISVHTWPERNYAAFDVFMCGEARPDKAVALLEEVFQPEKTEINEILRGKRV